MRHANALSVWTRFSCMSLIALAVWSRVWIGWYSPLPIAMAVAWLFANPRFFGVPESTRNWASRSVFGERIWLDRESVALPPSFVSLVPNLANAYACIGLVAVVYGLIVLEVLPVVAGIVVMHGAKLWYLARMVLLFEAMKERHPRYAAWEFG